MDNQISDVGKNKTRKLLQNSQLLIIKSQADYDEIKSQLPFEGNIRASIINIHFQKAGEFLTVCNRFINLQGLFLKNSEIGGIDFLINIQAMNLKELDLSNNHIVSVKPLRKCKFPQLYNLSLNNNCIKQADSLTEMHIKLKFYISFEEFDSVCFPNDLRFIAKMKNILSRLYIQNSERIINPNWIQMLSSKKKKGHLLNIYYYKSYGVM